MALVPRPSGNSYSNVQASNGAAIHCGDVVYHSVHHHHYTSDGRLTRFESKRSSHEPFPSEISDYDDANALTTQLERYLAGTCTWLWDKPFFQEWKSGKGAPILYVTGSVGSGKTVLAASTIKQLKLSDRGHGQKTIHFFISEGTGTGTELTHLLRALIRQIWQFMIEQSIEAEPTLANRMKTDFHQRKAAIPASDLGDILVQLVDTCSLVNIVIDAIDRFHEEEVTKFVGLTQVFATRCSQRLRMLCFCRDVLGRGIRPFSELPQSRHIAIGLSDVQDDIEHFVDHEIEQLQSLRSITESAQLIQEIRSVLKENSNKMFLWIYFQLQNIWNPSFTTCDDDIRKQLQDLPDGLEQTYIRRLERIEQNCRGRSQDIALKAFRWVASVKIPIKSRQLREAVSIDPQNLPLRAERVINTSIPQYCANLLDTHQATDTVFFAHHSVQSFLQAREKLPEHLRKYSLDVEADDLWCGEICIAYCRYLLSQRQLATRNTLNTSVSMKELLATEFSASRLGNLVDRSAQLLGWKARHGAMLPVRTFTAKHSGSSQDLDFHHYLRIGWLTHSRNMDRGTELFARFEHLCLSTDPIIYPWLHGNKSMGEHRQRLFEHAAAHDHIPLFLTVANDIERNRGKAALKKMLWQLSPDAKQTLLHLAAIRGSLNMVKKLLEYIDVNVRDEDGMNVVARAMQAHQNDVAMYLLKHSEADELDAHIFHSLSPSEAERQPHSNFLISVCASAGNLEGLRLVQSLRPRSASLNTLEWNETLFAACWYGHKDVAKYIMKAGGLDPFYMPCTPAAIRLPVPADTVGFALQKGYLSLVKTILELDGGTRGETKDVQILNYALQLRPQDSYRALELLLPAGLKVTPLRMTDGLGYTCLHHIIKNCSKSEYLPQFGMLPPRTDLSRQKIMFMNRAAMLVFESISCDQLPAFRTTLESACRESPDLLWLPAASDELLLYMFEHLWLHKVLHIIAWDVARPIDVEGDQMMMRFLWKLANRKSLRVLHSLLSSEVFQGTIPNDIQALDGNPAAKARFSDVGSQKYLLRAFQLVLYIHLGGMDLTQILNSAIKVFIISVLKRFEGLDHAAQVDVVMYMIWNLRQIDTIAARESWLIGLQPEHFIETPAFTDNSLNFPVGYEYVDQGWHVRAHIKMSIYFWSWRLNRKRKKTWSRADMELLRLLFDHHLNLVTSEARR